MARQAEDAANGTINRELSYLTRAFCLGAKNGMVAQRLDIEKLEEALPPEAFFELADIQALLAILPEDPRPVIETASINASRIRAELLTLQ